VNILTKKRLSKAARKWLIKAASVQENPFEQAELLYMVWTYG